MSVFFCILLWGETESKSAPRNLYLLTNEGENEKVGSQKNQVGFIGRYLGSNVGVILEVRSDLQLIAADLPFVPRPLSGSMCVCYSQTPRGKAELTYTVVLVHKGAQGRV